jgi:ABC-type uncharacterized transport system auxiliary subunit
MTAFVRIVFAAGLAGLAGCAIASKSAPLDVRYFDPGVAEPARGIPPADGPSLRLGRVTAAAHLRYRIVRRTSPVELRAYDSLRWTEYPETYVRRAVAGAVFAGRRIEQRVGGPGPTLDVEVVAFEQAIGSDGDLGSVELRYVLHDQRLVLTAGVIRVERRATAPGIAAIVGAIGAALEQAAGELADRIAARLARQP